MSRLIAAIIIFSIAYSQESHIPESAVYNPVWKKYFVSNYEGSDIVLFLFETLSFFHSSTR